MHDGTGGATVYLFNEKCDELVKTLDVGKEISIVNGRVLCGNPRCSTYEFMIYIDSKADLTELTRVR